MFYSNRIIYNAINPKKASSSRDIINVHNIINMQYVSSFFGCSHMVDTSVDRALADDISRTLSRLCWSANWFGSHLSLKYGWAIVAKTAKLTSCDNSRNGWNLRWKPVVTAVSRDVQWRRFTDCRIVSWLLILNRVGNVTVVK